MAWVGEGYFDVREVGQKRRSEEANAEDQRSELAAEKVILVQDDQRYRETQLKGKVDDFGKRL